MTAAVDPPSCDDCASREVTALFELCKDKLSEYRIDGAVQRVQFHTVGHMRDGRNGACGRPGILFKARAA